MKKISLKIALALLVAFMAQNALQAQFSLTGQFRTRAEANNGYKYIPVEGNVVQYYVSQRSRLTANYKSEKYDAKLSIQDVRAWGGEDIYSGAGIWGSSSGFDVYEAYVDLKLSDNSRLKIGRQELKYDDQRILSWRNWNQYGLTYDALLYKYKRDDWRFDLGLTYNSTDSKILGDTKNRNNYYYTDMNRMKTLNFAYLKKEFSKSFYAALTGIYTGYAKSDTSNEVNALLTYGLHANYKKSGLSFKTNLYMQGGKSKTGMDKSAYFITADAGYMMNGFRPGVGIDIISGHDDSNEDADYQDTDHVFNLMYGARFKYYGWLNHFVIMSKHTKGGGLVDIYPNITYKMNKSTILKAFYHLYSLEGEVADPNGGYYDKSLGSAIDFMYIQKVNKEINLKAGFSYSMPSETLETFKSASGTEKSPYWGWIMLTVKPTFFKN